jgi:uncharacterized protein (TIGR02646 family)
MRKIRLDDLRPKVSREWLDDASTALAAVASADEAQRASVIAEYQKIWGRLKDDLRALSHEKCWYCETTNVRADNAVDHFRPKSRYWWLAFEWTNYRFICTFCNSKRKTARTAGGKGDEFPLADEAMRGSREQGLDREVPMLLDPTSDVDPGLLWFQEDGNVRPFFDPAKNDHLHRRAAISITKYHLHQPELVERRQRTCTAIRDLVTKATKQVEELGRGTYAAQRVLAERVQEMKILLEPSSEFSAAAKCMLMGLADRYEVAALALR